LDDQRADGPVPEEFLAFLAGDWAAAADLLGFFGF
jgi:hypothetical protein